MTPPDASPALAPDADGARCTLHADQVATFTCQRCGAFACLACGGPPLCFTCRERAARQRPEVRVSAVLQDSVRAGRVAWLSLAPFLLPHVGIGLLNAWAFGSLEGSMRLVGRRGSLLPALAEFAFNFTAATVASAIIEGFLGAIYCIADDALAGRRADARAQWTRSAPSIGALIAINLLIGAVATVGYFACCIPTIAVSLLTLVSGPMVVLEGRGPIEALRLGAGVARQYAAPFLALVLIPMVAEMVVGSVGSALQGPLRAVGLPSWIQHLPTAVMGAVCAVWAALIEAATWRRVRDTSAEGLAS